MSQNKRCVSMLLAILFVSITISLPSYAQQSESKTYTKPRETKAQPPDLVADNLLIDCNADPTASVTAVEYGDKQNTLRLPIYVPNNEDSHSHLLIFPADAKSIIFEGATKSNGTITGYEKKRDPLIYKDIAALAEHWEPIPLQQKGFVKPYVHCFKYVESLTRGTSTVDLVDANKDIHTYTMNTGAKEHLDITAAIPINSPNQLSYDSSTKQITPNKQSTFYGSIDGTFGDLIEEPKNQEFYQKLEFKFLFAAEKHITNSMGLGLGYRLNSGISLFAARVRTKGKTDAAGDTQSTIFGICASIPTIVGWLKK